MQETIKIKIKTLSNLMIGGAPAPFEIGGVDQYTATTYDGFPYIPASTLKGALRAMVREDKGEDAKAIAKLYGAYLNSEKEKHWEEIEKKYDEEAQERIRDRYNKPGEAEFLFGIEGFNHSPKIIVNDLYLCETFHDKSKCFSIDAKTSIQKSDNAVVSNPRTYKAARGGLVFEGELLFYKMEQLGEHALEQCKEYIIKTLEQFNDGIYRLGNSKSRGYGKIEVIIKDSEVV
jgi:CRISPR-associated protein Csm3